MKADSEMARRSRAQIKEAGTKRSRQVLAVKGCARQISTQQNRVLQICVAQVGIRKICVGEIGSLEVRRAQVSSG
jgi:hypothetical protein